MTYLLDTCVISDFVKGERGVVDRLLSLSPDEVAVSAVSLMEVEYGLALNVARAKKLRPQLKAFFDSTHLLPFAGEEAVCAAAIRAELKKIGTPIGPYDVLLAGTALHHDLVFVTSNTGEFQRVKDLVVEDWRRREDNANR